MFVGNEPNVIEGHNQGEVDTVYMCCVLVPGNDEIKFSITLVFFTRDSFAVNVISSFKLPRETLIASSLC